jgi:hypothetical protein
MFCDKVQVEIGDETVTVTRLTVKELRENRAIFAEGKECLEDAYARLIAEHCKTADGKSVNAEELSLAQLAKLAKELAGVPEGSPLSDFIGLLC